MKITILGTGCIWTKRACAGYLINDDVLIDPGSGALKQLFKSTDSILHHEKINKIKLFLITHFHVDHYFDIVHFMWKIASKKNDLHATIICPPGGEEKIRMLCRLGIGEASYRKLDFKNHVTFIDASTLDSFEYGDFTITSHKMDHGAMTCYGYTIKEKNGKTVSFTGDTTMCDSVMDMVHHSDMAFIDMAGTDASNSHFNIVDGIELMEEYKDKCCIVPCHLTSQALDYCQGRINPPKDLMVIDTNENLPYDYTLKKVNTESSNVNKNFKFAGEKFRRIKGELVDLVLSITKQASANYKMPTYCYDIVLPSTSTVIGSVTYSVVPNNIDGHADNVNFTFEKNYDMMSIKYECCMLIKKLAKFHKAKLVYLTCAPDDFSTRKVFEILHAKLKEIKTYIHTDKKNVRHKTEKCIWIWEFSKKNGKQ